VASAISPAQSVSGAGQQLVFKCPPTQLVNPTHAVIFNKSSYELNFMNQLVPAWSIIPYDIGAILGGATTIVMTSLLAPGGIVAPVAAVYVQWLDSAEDAPDQQAFIADAVAAAISGVISAQEELLATLAITPTSTGFQNVALPAWVASITLVFANPNPVLPGIAGLFAVGANSGSTYFNGNNGIAQNVWHSPVTFDVVPGLEPAGLNFNWNLPGGGSTTVYVVGVSLPAGGGGPSDPIVASLTDPLPREPFSGSSVSAAANTTQGLLAAPLAGYVWEISLLAVEAGTTVTAATAAYVAGNSSGARLLLGWSNTIGLAVTITGVGYVGEGLSLHNTTAVQATASVMARQVPLASSLS
jgi:hypothetical protein